METERIEERAEELIVNAIDFIEKSGSFVAEQAPLVVQEFLGYHALMLWIKLGMWAMTAAIFVAAYVYLIRKCVSWRKKDGPRHDGTHESDGFIAFGSLFMLIASAVFIQIITRTSLGLIKIYTAPRVYLIEELPKLIGG